MLTNWLKTTILMAAIVALFGVIGAMIGGIAGLLREIFHPAAPRPSFSKHPCK